jgi:hypothetical protein
VLRDPWPYTFGASIQTLQTNTFISFYKAKARIAAATYETAFAELRMGAAVSSP